MHLHGKRNPANGDWTLLWTRRTRIGGDSWAGLEVPLAEERELYRLEILDAPGGEVLRSVELDTPPFLYTAAMQAADFGSLQWKVPMRVAQVSPVYGPGVTAEQLTYDYQHSTLCPALLPRSALIEERGDPTLAPSRYRPPACLSAIGTPLSRLGIQHG